MPDVWIIVAPILCVLRNKWKWMWKKIRMLPQKLSQPISLEPSTHFLHKKIAWGGFKITAQQRSHATFLRLRFCLFILWRNILRQIKHENPLSGTKLEGGGWRGNSTQWVLFLVFWNTHLVLFLAFWLTLRYFEMQFLNHLLHNTDLVLCYNW